MTTESVKPLIYPSGLWGWPDLPSHWCLNAYPQGNQYDKTPYWELMRPKDPKQDDAVYWDGPVVLAHIEGNRVKVSDNILSPAEWRVLNQIIEWCWISLQEHQRTGEVEDVTFSHPTDHDVQRTLLMQDCSCGSRWLHDSQEPDLGWIHVTNSLPTEPRRVDVIEAT